LTAKGKIAVETKDDMRKRGKKSPDKADAAIQARFGAVGGAILGGALGGSAPNGKRPAVTAGLKRRQM
jgi:hypothetical protein